MKFYPIYNQQRQAIQLIRLAQEVAGYTSLQESLKQGIYRLYQGGHIKANEEAIIMAKNKIKDSSVRLLGEGSYTQNVSLSDRVMVLGDAVRE